MAAARTAHDTAAPTMFVMRARRSPDENGAQQPRGSGRIVEGVPLARLIPRELSKAPEIVMVAESRSPAAERYRRLRTLVHHDANGSPQVILVTSALPGEGKSTTAINLALAFASDDRGEVLLVDADTRRPTVGRWVEPPPSLGLSDVIEGSVGLDHAILDVKKTRLKVLSAGDPSPDPVRMLSSEAIGKLFSTLRERFSRIIVDSPPIVPFTDADVIGAQCDGALIVARSGVTPRPALEQALNSVTSTRILGIVLNDVQFSLADRHRNYESYYRHYYDKVDKP
jgi:capsular exopolysaccharide synthesis family protein